MQSTQSLSDLCLDTELHPYSHTTSRQTCLQAAHSTSKANFHLASPLLVVRSQPATPIRIFTQPRKAFSNIWCVLFAGYPLLLKERWWAVSQVVEVWSGCCIQLPTCRGWHWKSYSVLQGANKTYSICYSMPLPKTLSSTQFKVRGWRPTAIRREEVRLRPWPGSSVFSVSSWSLDISHRLEKQTNTFSSLPATLTYRIPLRFKCENIFNPRCVSRTHHVRSFMPREMWLLWHLLPDHSCGTFQGFEDRNMYSTSQIMKLQRTSSSPS